MIKYLKIKFLKDYLFIIKIYYLLLLIIFYKRKVNCKNISFFEVEKKKYFTLFFSLQLKPLDNNNSLIIKEKNDILTKISKDLGKNLSLIDKIFLTDYHHFGNLISLLNKFIFCCEIIGCKSIILDKKHFWFIKKQMNIKNNKFNYTIEVDDISKYINNSSTIFYKASNFFYYFFNLKPQIRIHLLRDEILKNLPILNTSNEDLYIHIRSGDIFNMKCAFFYSQPPLCFYINILTNFNFSNIYLISADKQNPVINKLII